MSDIVGRILGEEELSTLSEDVRSKLTKEFVSKESLVDSLKGEVETVTADYEQKCYEIDKRMIEMSTQLDTETSNCTKATSRCAELENEMRVIKEKSTALEMNFAESQGEMAALKRTHDIWKEEKLSMQHLVEKRDLEINELKGDWKVLSDKLATVTGSKNEIELKLDELQNSGVTVQYHNKRLEREKEMLTQQNGELNEELKTKSAELNSVKLQKENELVSLRSRLEVKMDECKQLGMVSENLRTTNDDLEKKINDLLEKANASDEERRSMEELYRNELQSQVNLAELYKASAKDEEEKSKELASAVQELQKLVTESEKAHKATQEILKVSEKNVTDMNYENELLKKESEKANDLLGAQKSQSSDNLTAEELAVLCPTAAMASKFIKSGMTLTEMYTKYIDALDEIEVSKRESKRLNDSMDAILEELNEKAPILKQQREDYERALATITQLTSQMDAAAIECQQLRAETDDAGRKLGRVEREKKRLQMETGDLSTQVRFLLKELEESRGHNVSMNRSMDAEGGVSSSSEVISGHLVTFKSIEELQSQNQRLLQVVRELSDASEKKESENQSDELKQLKETLDQANEELERLRENRTRQTEFVEAIVRQRDMYRVLLSQEPKSGIPLSIIGSPAQIAQPKKGTNDSGSKLRRSLQDDVSSSSSSEALKVLKNEFDEYKREVQGNNKVMNTQTESLRSQITELRLDNAKLQASVNFSAEKYNVMKQSFDNIRKESEMHREKNSKLLVMIQKHELSYNSVTNDLTVARQAKAKHEATIENMQSELDILRRTEDRVRSENASLQRDQRGQSVLLANLQKIQQSMEKQEFEVRSELRSRLESQERELKALRRTTNETVQQKQASLQMTEKQLLATRKNFEQLRSEKEVLSAEIRNLKSELEGSRLEQQSSASKLTALEQRLSRLVGDKVAKIVKEKGDSNEANEEAITDLKELKEKCASLEEEVASLKMKSEKAQRAVQQHKEFATAAEESLKQANNANRELSEALEARLKNASEHQTKLEQRIAILEDENRQLNSNKTTLISEVDLRTADLNKQLASLQNELDMVLKREKELRKSEQDARGQFTDQMDLIHDAQNKYQREMLLHAESVKELMELKEKFKKIDAEFETAKNDAQQAKHLLDSNRGMWEKQRVKLDEENEEIKQRNKDMNEQLTALHTQLETMSNQMVVLQQKQTASPPAKYGRTQSQRDSASTSAEGTKDQSNEQLMDIIKFLRKEKNLCEVKYEVAQSESNRLKQQVSHMQKQTDEAKKALHTEQQKSQASSSELSKHETLMKKVETLNVLSDSNRMLREEKERLQAELQATKSGLMEMKQKLAPMQVENNQFSTQIATLKSEKVMLEQDVQRWQQRSQQLLQSPRRQDPEEYRKLLNEKQKLNGSINQLNKDITEKKMEASNLQGEIRNLNQQMETVKSENITFAKAIEIKDGEVKTKQAEIEEKNKTIAQIRRVGRRYKMQFEELQKKQQEMESNQQKTTDESRTQETAAAAASEATVTEQAAKISAIEASLIKMAKEKEETYKIIQAKMSEIEALKNELQQAKHKMQEESQASSSEVVEQNQKLVQERDEIKKQLQDKDDKSKRLLTLAKTRIEAFRKDKEEVAAERDRLRSEEEKRKTEIEKLKQDVKTESDQKTEMQSKIDELQKQLTAATSQQQQQNKVTSVVGHQIHHHSGSGSMEIRKAANIRPISTQRVSQVSPMRVTRTARVMPEPQQEAQEGSSTDSMPARSSPLTQIASSSHHAGPMSVSTSSTMPTRAFVHPINPSSGRHQHVVSATPTSSAILQIPTRSDATQAEQAVVRGNTSSSTDNQPQEAAISSVVAMPTDVSESDQAIVSSSDDQTPQSEDGQPPIGLASSGQAQTSSTSTATESEAAPSQSSTASSSGDALVPASSIPVLISRQVYKRSYDDTTETNSTTDETPASSSDAQVSALPVSKRQRSSPDQSSAAVQPLTLQPIVVGESSSTQVQQAESSVFQPEVKSSSEGDPGTSRQEERREDKLEDDRVGTSTTFTPILEMEVALSSESQSQPTSSGTGDVIIVSSDDEADEVNLNVEQEQEDGMYEEEEEAVIDVEPEDGEIEPGDLMDQVPSNSVRPVLVLHPTPPEIFRNRAPIRPAPLTPGLVPPVGDDGDGIVPCTPTLPTRRHDDNYQTINSPHVPPGGPPTRFRFEDVPMPVAFQSQSGIGVVDNTIMDFSDEARTVPTTPVPASITTVTHTLLEPTQPAVSSSINEEDEGVDDEKDDAGGEMCVPISSSLQEDAGNADNSSSVDNRETTSNLGNIRGRRIRLIGGRSRGKGGTSPSTSTQ